ncbi:TonB-dependent receptor [bacterium]|nr:TonB-dependent receptor [bacterium]
MRNLLFWIFLFALIPSFAAQALKGKVMDTDEYPVGGAKVTEVQTGKHTFTDVDGSFTLFMTKFENQIQIEANGYQSVKMDVYTHSDMTIFLVANLFENQYNLEGLAGYTDFQQKNPNKQLDNMPYLLGEADVNRQLQMLPGIEFGPEGFSNLYVRGGNVDENLMLYNGTPIYNFNHLFGFSSVFHNNSISNTKVFKGPMPTEYGGRLSSVILLESDNDLEFSGFDGRFEASPISAGLYFKAVQKDDYYFNLSARRTWVDQLFPKEFREDELNANFYNVALNFGKKLSNSDFLEFSFLNSRDLYRIFFNVIPDSNNAERTRFGIQIKWGNVLGSVKYTHAFNKRFTSVHSIHLSQFYSNEDQSEEILNSFNTNGIPTSYSLYKSGIREYIARSDYNYFIDNFKSVEFGLHANVKTFRTGFIERGAINYPNLEDNFETVGEQLYDPSFEITAYGEYNYRTKKNVEFIGGLRSTLYAYNGFIKPTLQPRVHVTYPIDERTVVKGGYSRQNQFTRLINIGGSGDPRNFWVPATELVPNLAANVVEVSLERKLAKMYSGSLSAYFKTMNNIQVVDNFLEASDPENDWQAYTFLGTGRAYGAELVFQKNKGYFTGWASYVLSRASRNFPDLSQEEFLFDFDRTHMVKVYMAYEIDDLWSFGMNYLLGSGQLFTIPEGKFYDIDGNLQLEYGELNNFRSPAYQRLDLCLVKNSDPSKTQLDQTWKFYVYNITASRNPLSITPRFNDSRFSKLDIVRGYVKFLPGISYVVNF